MLGSISFGMWAHVQDVVREMTEYTVKSVGKGTIQEPFEWSVFGGGGAAVEKCIVKK